MSAQIATGRGTWAEQVALPARLLAAAPTTVPLAAAAALPLAGLTALQALKQTAVTEGDHVLIIGAAGAVGGIAVQLARHTEATVDALVSCPEHLDAARELGAERVWHAPADLPRRTFTAVLDTAGTDAGPALVPGGRYVHRRPSAARHPRGRQELRPGRPGSPRPGSAPVSPLRMKDTQRGTGPPDSGPRPRENR